MEVRNTHSILDGNTEGKGPFSKRYPVHHSNIKINFG